MTEKKIVLAGGTGFVGKYLKEKYIQLGYEVIILSRQKNCINWNFLFMQAVVNRILEQWAALIMYFEDVSTDPDKYTYKNSKALSDGLKAPQNKLYFLFLSYVLSIINKLNIEFQSETPKIHILYKRISELYRTNFTKFH